MKRGRQQRPWRRSDVARIAFQILSLCQREADTYEGKKPQSVCSRSPLFRWHRAATLHTGKHLLGTGLKKQGSYSGSEFSTDASTDTDGPRASREACLLLVACGAVGALLCPTGQDRLPAARTSDEETTRGGGWSCARSLPCLSRSRAHSLFRCSLLLLG